jgi:hypothetical protein
VAKDKNKSRMIKKVAKRKENKLNRVTLETDKKNFCAARHHIINEKI